MNDNSMGILCGAVIFVLVVGEPDLLDALIVYFGR
jgi:hypothetical protein